MINQFLADTIKIHYNDLGYTQHDLPYHQISDKEMAMMFAGSSSFANTFFGDTYPLRGINKDDIVFAVWDLVLWLQREVNKAIEDPEYVLDPVVYSYMLGKPIGPTSSVDDITYLANLTKDESLAGLTTFTPELARKCLAISRDWINKSPAANRRPPSPFGEPNVIKSLRLQDISVL